MPVNPKSLDNLKSWKPGQSGNKKGKAKGTRNVSTYLKKFLDARTPVSVQDGEDIKEFVQSKKITNAEAIALKLIRKAVVDGNLEAIKIIQDRIEGRPGQYLDITTDGEQITGFTFNVVQGEKINETDTTKSNDNEGDG